MTNHVSKRLRLVQKGYENYSGPIGAYEFVEGVSVELIPLNARDRLSAAFQMAEIDEDGAEMPSGVAERLVRDRANRVEPTAPLVRMNEEDKRVENIRVVLGAEALRPLYTEAVLEKVAKDKGIAGVRVLAETWDVRSKSIPDLIGMILNAQSVYVNERVESLVGKGADRAEVEAMFALSDEVPAIEDKPRAPKAEKAEKVTVGMVDAEAGDEGGFVTADPVAPKVQTETKPEEASDAVQTAAATGDLAAALNQTE
jgi:hypothetical protein